MADAETQANPAGNGEPDLVELLVSARRDATPIAVDRLGEAAIPSSAAAALIVDDNVCERLGAPLGWKVGCTSVHAQELLGADGPFPGRVYDVMQSGAVVGESMMNGRSLLEGEFAFTIGQGLEVGSQPPTRAEVLAAVSTIHPAIEVVGGRYDRFLGIPLPLVIADAGANRLIILGDGQPFGPDGIADDSLAERVATMTVDGRQTGQGSGADVLGDPFGVLVWLAEHLWERSLSLRTGDVITTGTATQVTELEPGQTAIVAIEGLGTATLTRSENQ